MLYRFKEFITEIETIIEELSSINFYETDHREDILIGLKETIELFFLKYPFNPTYWIVRFNGINYEHIGSGLACS